MAKNNYIKLGYLRRQKELVTERKNSYIQETTQAKKRKEMIHLSKAIIKKKYEINKIAKKIYQQLEKGAHVSDRNTDINYYI